MKVTVEWLVEEMDVPSSCFWSEIVSEHRWYDEMVGAFNVGDKVYLVNYTEDASESQDGQFDSPFEMFQDAHGLVDLHEAEAYEVVEVRWRRK